MFEVAEAYERQRGRSSKILAPLFVDFVDVKGEVLDVGCGTGALTFAVAKNEKVSKIVAIDRSEAFLAYARSRTDDPRILQQHMRYSALISFCSFLRSMSMCSRRPYNSS